MSHPKERTNLNHPGPKARDGICWWSYKKNHSGEAVRQASPWKFRVIGEDHKYYQDDYPIAEYDTFEEAVECARAHDADDEWFFVYDDVGALRWAGSGKKPGWPK